MKNSRAILLLIVIFSWPAIGVAPTIDSQRKSGTGCNERPPNIVFVLTDDLNVEVYSQMTRLRSMLVEQGTSFQNHFVSLSLCCPSRTAILRGQYAHNTGIFTNAPPNGDLRRSTRVVWSLRRWRLGSMGRATARF